MKVSSKRKKDFVLLMIHRKIDSLAEMILERDKKQGRWRSLEHYAKDERRKSRRESIRPRGNPQFGRLLRCFSSTCNVLQAFVVAPCIQSKLRLPMDLFFYETSAR